MNAYRIATALRARRLRAPQLVAVLGAPDACTRYALSIAASLTLMSRPVPVLLFAPGADKLALLRRLIAAWKPSQLPTLRARMARLRAAPLFISNTPRPWPVELWLTTSRIDRALKRRGQSLGFIIVDDLQRIGGRSYEQRVSDLAFLARETERFVIVLARPHPSLARALRRQRIASTSLEDTP